MSSSEVLKHKRSGLLSADDNDLIFKLVGPTCQTLSTTVIELHRNLGPKGDGDWSKEEVGVLCLVRDLIKKCHFFRIFCLIRKRKVWEYVIHNRMRYSTPDPFLHFFQVEDCTYAFYFVSEQEAAQMHEILVQVLDNYDRKPNLAEYDKMHEINPVIEGPSKSTLKLNGNRENVGRRLLNFGKQFRRFKIFSKKDDEEKKKRAPKFEISPPRDFKHVSHICEFKERMSQIKTSDMWNDKISLKNPSSTMTSTSPRTLDRDIAPPLPEKKSPRFDHRVLPANASKSDSIRKSMFLHCTKTSDTAPPLPEKKSPRPVHRGLASMPRDDVPMQYQFTASVKPAEASSENVAHQSPTYQTLDEDGIAINKPSFSAANTAHVGSRVSTSTSISFGNDRMQYDFTATLSPSNALKTSPRSPYDSSRFKFPGEDNFRINEFAESAENKSSRLSRQYSISKASCEDSGHYNIIDAVKRSMMNGSTCSPISSPTYLSSSEKNTHRRTAYFPSVSHSTQTYQNVADKRSTSPHVFVVDNALPKKYEHRNHVTRSPPPPYIVSAEMKPSAGLIDKSYTNDFVSSSEYETLPPPRPVSTNESPQSGPVYDESAQSQCHYDVITTPPRPIIPTPPSLRGFDKVNEQTSSNLAYGTKSASPNYWSQTSPAENVRRVELKSYAMNAPTTAHQYLPSTCSTAASTRFPGPRALPVSLIADINRGVKLKPVERK